MRKPICKQCGHGDNLVRWGEGWICTEHLKVDNKRTLVRKTILPPGVHVEEDEPIKFRDLYPNRAARRRAKAIRSSHAR